MKKKLWDVIENAPVDLQIGDSESYAKLMETVFEVMKSHNISLDESQR